MVVVIVVVIIIIIAGYDVTACVVLYTSRTSLILIMTQREKKAG